LNGDSLPDVYDVTFLDGEDVFTRICRSNDGVPRSCAPAGFAAAPDHVYFNRGDGTFGEVTQELGFEAADGDGLGIVVADFDGSGHMGIFVGNDGRANFFFAPTSTAKGDLHWQEIGVLSGLAYDDSGAAQACMGVAAGDPNNDGRVDLFVTNFYNESNTLYVNLGPNVFTDRARSSGLREPSWSLLGFGTQFLDADLDGWEDLIVTNGHVDDFTHKQIPFKMRPQFFQNRNARFSERFGKDLGPFFDQPKLGRGLAKLDWNRDGRTDIAVSNIGDPASLLTNQTHNAGCGLGLRFTGTKGSRDAIGTRVVLVAKGARLERQLTAGDGYQSCNERRLEFGLGEDRTTVDLEVHWPGGMVEKFPDVETGTEYRVVEGRGQLLRLRFE
jgi:hypothetical protein